MSEKHGHENGENTTALPQAAAQAAWPEPVEVGERQVAYRLTVKAGADELWALLADPHRHHEVDGSGTVKEKVEGPHRLAVGDRFKVHMKKYRVPYVMPLTVTGSEPGRLIEWAHPGGHRWRWEFRDNGDGTTEVTETFDYSWAKPAVGTVYERLRLDRENGRGISASLTRLAARYA
jgi:hypothetical protein